ncbi:MAG: TadE/TadG family type IV pilus assembly protein [Pseudomonadota bacterium]
MGAFARARAGNIAITYALAAPVLLGCGALSLDFANAWSSQQTLQSVADGAALAAATELPLRSTNASTVRSIVAGYVHGNAGRVAISDIESTILENRSGVRVALTARVSSIFGSMFHPQGYAPMAEAVARLAGGAPLCALALEQMQPHGVYLTDSARLDAPNCAVLSNSQSPQSIAVVNNSKITATMICSSGGAEGYDSNYVPHAITDCPAIPDPLAGREEPNASGCDHLLTLSVLGNKTLSPGVYCGGLTILPGASATLSPGIYVMKNGPLLVMNGATLNGEHVGFYFVGDLSTMTLSPQSQINLTAPRDGPMAGFLFFANRVLLTGDLNLRHFRISSDNARNLLGTIYLRDGVLDVDANRPIADRSAYTVIVARRIQVSAGPDLVLNTDYESTDVPVPDGVGPQKPHAYLAQ